MAFTTQFDSYVCEGDTISTQAGPLVVTARVVYDHDSTPMDYDAPGCCFDTSDAEFGEENRKTIQAWKDDEWFYCGLVLSVVHADTGVELSDHGASLWGIECNYPGSDNSYLCDAANELLDEAIEQANQLIESIRK